MLSGHKLEPPPALPVAAFFGFSPRLAVDQSTGDTFISAGSSVLVFDAEHSQILARYQLFAHGCISCIIHSNRSLIAASGSHICILTDEARAQGAQPQIVRCGRSHVLACACARTTAHPLVALLQGGGCRGTGVVVHFSAGCDARLSVAKIVDAPAWPSKTGGMCSCACINVEAISCSDRFICATGVNGVRACAIFCI
jgi:hypothetical protein